MRRNSSCPLAGVDLSTSVSAMHINGTSFTTTQLRSFMLFMRATTTDEIFVVYVAHHKCQQNYLAPIPKLMTSRGGPVEGSFWALTFRELSRRSRQSLLIYRPATTWRTMCLLSVRRPSASSIVCLQPAHRLTVSTPAVFSVRSIANMKPVIHRK